MHIKNKEIEGFSKELELILKEMEILNYRKMNNNANNIDKSEIDWLIPHQANIRIIKATAKKLNLPMERVILTIAEQGNTSAASIPLALDEAIRDGRIKRGQKLLMEAIGAGFAWGSALIEY